MKIVSHRPYSGSRLAVYVERRVSDLRPQKSQVAIAAAAGFRQPNMLAMVKNGSTRLPLDRVPGLAAALECDAAMLFRMALEQLAGDTWNSAIQSIFGAIVTENEAAWLKAIREASNNTDPSLTSKGLRAIRELFGR